MIKWQGVRAMPVRPSNRLDPFHQERAERQKSPEIMYKTSCSQQQSVRTQLDLAHQNKARLGEQCPGKTTVKCLRAGQPTT